MRLLSRIGLVGLVMTLAFSLGSGAANAASKKKKESKKTEKKEVRHESRHSSNHYISGTNLWGRSGLLFGDTSDVAAVGQVEGSVHLTYQSLASVSFGTYSIDSSSFGIPFGAHFGVAKNVDLNAGAQLNILSVSSNVPGFTGTSSTNFTLDLGGKYRIAATSNKMPDFSVGADVMIPTYTGGQVVFMPKGTVSYTLESGLLLNGEMGIGISTVTYVMADAGVGIPFGDKFEGIAEIGANQYGYLGSMLGLGARAALSGLNVQALLGVPLNGGGVMFGGGISLASK